MLPIEPNDGQDDRNDHQDHSVKSPIFEEGNRLAAAVRPERLVDECPHHDLRESAETEDCDTGRDPRTAAYEGGDLVGYEGAKLKDQNGQP